MRISVFGLGYVGVVTAGCLARAGHEVWGVDVNADKVAMIEAGRSPILEPGLAPMIGDARAAGRLRASTDAMQAIAQTDLSLICVGTPGRANGSLDLGAVERVAREIGAGLRHKPSRHCVVLRSTVLPGTTRKVFIPALEAAARKPAHRDFQVCYHPEFLREGSSIRDYFNPPFTVIGQHTAAGGSILAALYEGADAALERTSYEAAEMLKYACNGFHALKVAFANEVGVLCKSMGLDSHEVMRLFALDRKLNLSAAYLTPGFAFGGSCLPKDLRALAYKAKQHDLRIPVLEAVMESNRLQIQRAIDLIAAHHRKHIGFLGLSFKPGTDDLRESPIVPVIETLIGRGFEVRVYDADVRMASLVGANRHYIEQEIPHISRLLAAGIDELVRESEVIVIGKPAPEYRDSLARDLGARIVIDLARALGRGEPAPASDDNPAQATAGPGRQQENVSPLSG